MPTLGWERAYRSGDLVRYEEEGLLFLGRADDQVKVGGRRIELGEIDSALLALPGVTGAAAAVRRTGSGNALLVGYVATSDEFDAATSLATLRATMPAALVPRLARVDTLPTRTSGKIDRDALPWPLATAETAEPAQLDGTAGALQGLWAEILGASVTSPEDDFFDLGGGSLAAAQLVSRLRATYPEVTVAVVYDHPRIRDLAEALDELATPAAYVDRTVRPVSRRSQVAQMLLTIPLRSITGLRWLVWVALGTTAAAQWFDIAWLPTAPWPVVITAWLLLVAAPGRMLLTAAGVRAILAGVGPGTYPRGGAVHLRVWLAERLADELGAANLAGATLMRLYARLLGAHVGRHVDLHSVPPDHRPPRPRGRVLGRARGRPVRALARRRPPACRRASRSVPTPASGRAAPWLPGPSSAPAPRSRRAPRSSARFPTESCGQARRPGRARPLGDRGTNDRATARCGWWATP